MNEQHKPPHSPLEQEIIVEETRDDRGLSTSVNHHQPEEALVLEDPNTRLSHEQRRTAHELRRLFQSLAGGQPGQYWPQALLDTAGRFNRPPFPVTRPNVATRGGR